MAPSVYDKVIAVISKPQEQRTDFECHDLVPWIRKQNKLFSNLKHEILKDLIKNCHFQRSRANDVIIKQGDIGDAMYATLKGSVSIYILPEMEENVCQYLDRVCSKPKPERNLFGQHIFSQQEGFVFGDVALIRDCTRTASVLADEECDLLVLNRLLYNRTVREVLNLEWQEKTQFVLRNPIFKEWSPKHRKQLVISLRKESYQFGAVIARQGQPVQNIYFILKGEVEVSMDLSLHKSQQPELWTEIESNFAELISTNRSNGKTAHHNRQRRSRVQKISLLSSNEHIGSLEIVLDTRKHLDTTTVAGEVELLVLDRKHYERLLVKKHPQSVESLKKELTIRQLLVLSRLYHPTETTVMKYVTMKLLNGDMSSKLTHQYHRQRRRHPVSNRYNESEISRKVRTRLHMNSKNTAAIIPGENSKKMFLNQLEYELQLLMIHLRKNGNIH
ncbi:cAMP-dependent protein kinase regulatory subunit isoform X1 [Octopus bimaculoides]|nr:cAMP-dependent protein kinase regulatory subunit isoform X1 [Octopus bimaculoides]|eukprot:XP_014782896.1 PREDICTED: cAMP-dependent protein kinase regulatory subunit-like isoform X1 [Octopus bimaculoides]